MTSEEVRRYLIAAGCTPESVDNYILREENEMHYPETVWGDVYRTLADVLEDYHNHIRDEIAKMQRKDRLYERSFKTNPDGDGK